jgi:hypothetical protein
VGTATRTVDGGVAGIVNGSSMQRWLMSAWWVTDPSYRP